MTTTSVALCTYNGARFLGEQLASYAAQEVLPGELVVCDDGSSDGTAAIIERFAADAPFPVRFERNPDRLGVTANFARAISLCTGDVVFMSDQDDVWLPGKIRLQTEVFDSDPAIGAVFSDATVVDETLRPIGRTMFEATGFSRRRRRQFAAGGALRLLMQRSVVCGATLAFRRSLGPLLLPIPASGLHDVWIAGIAAGLSRIVAVEAPLVLYRQHGANQVGAPPGSWRAKRARRRAQGVAGDEASHYRAMHERLVGVAAAGHGLQPTAERMLAAKIAHIEFRNSVPPPGAMAILVEYGRGRYHRYSRGLESAAFDLLLRQKDNPPG